MAGVARLQIWGGGVRTITAVGFGLALVLGVFLYLLWGSGTSHAAGAITVEKVSGKEATYRATDNFVPGDGQTSTWHFVVIIPQGVCDADAFSDAADAIPYVEGDDQKVAFSGTGMVTICFRSSTTTFSDPAVLYGGISTGDNVGPKVAKLFYYTGASNLDDHPVTLNAGHVGADRTFVIQFNEFVVINENENGGDGPRLKLNVGEDRYAYWGANQASRARLIWYFNYYPQAGDNTADLDVIGFELNGATIADEHGNDFILANSADFFDGHVAATQTVIIDTSPPVITVGLVRGNKIRATATDNLDSTVAFFKRRLVDTSSSLSQNACDSTNTDSFSDYTADTDISLTPVGYSACFHAKDAAGNSAYALSTAALAPPTVSVNPASNHANLKRSITVRASSSSPGIVASSWKNKNLAGLAACDEAALASPFEFGAQKTLDHEAYNGNRVCFGVRDNNHNWGYGVSGLITNIDRTPPVITVQPSVASSNTKLAITVSAGSTSFDINENSWRHKVIPAATGCNGSSMSSSTAPGLEVTINSETQNNHKVCFTVKDTAGNRSYRSSGEISGIDRTAPAIVVSSVTNNEVSATVSDTNDNSPTFQSKIISDNTCDSTVSGFTSYVASTALTLTAGSRACFYASDFLSNTRYVASAPGVDMTNTEVVADTTPPTITVSPASPDSNPKRAITVRASSSSSDVAAGSWKHKIISASTACDADAVASATTAGRSAYLASESNNNHKVCFAVKDTSNNWNHAASGTISGIDRTPPVIAVGDVSNNRVSATVSDDIDSSPAFKSQVIGDSVCSSLTGGSFDTYLPGTELTLAVDSRACFYARDSAGNVAYASSTAAVYIAPPPTSLPTVNVGDVSRNNRVSATIDGDLTNSPVLEIRLISDSNCGPDTAGAFNPYAPGTSISLSAGSRACFKLRDNTGHEDYAVSAAGSRSQQSGGSTQRPQNPRPRPPAKAGLKVTVMTGTEATTASDNYASGQTTMSYRVQPTTSCPGSAASGFKAYQEGTALNPDSNSDYYICFQSVDKTDLTNIAYGLSSRVVVDPDPDQTPETIDPDPPSTPDPGVNVVIEESGPLQQQPADGAAAGAQTDTDPTPVAIPGSSSVDEPGDFPPPVSVSDPSDPIDQPDPGDSPPTTTTDSDSKIGKLIFVLALIALIGAVLVRVVAPKRKRPSRRGGV